mgnify:CR=1 FL=1
MKTYKNIDEYITSAPEETKGVLEKLRQTISDAVPQAEEAIRYGIPTLRMDGRNIVHFAGYQKHIGLYPGASGIRAFEKELSPYQTSKGAIQFPLGKALPWGLIRKIVRFRVKEEQTKK